MKKYIPALVAFVVCLVLMMSLNANASDMDEDSDPVATYELEIPKVNRRVVEFIPKNAPHILCVVYDVYSDPTMACFKREDK